MRANPSFNIWHPNGSSVAAASVRRLIATTVRTCIRYYWMSILHPDLKARFKRLPPSFSRSTNFVSCAITWVIVVPEIAKHLVSKMRDQPYFTVNFEDDGCGIVILTNPQAVQPLLQPKIQRFSSTSNFFLFGETPPRKVFMTDCLP